MDKESFKKKVYEKYNNINNMRQTDSFFTTPILRKNKLNNIKKVAIIIVAVLFMTSGIYAIVQKKYSVNLNPSFFFENEINENNIWVASFQIAWNELCQAINQENISFENYESKLANELNKKTFTKDMLSDNSYFVATGKPSKQLKNNIITNVKEKFKIENLEVLNKINFNSPEQDNSLIIYSIIHKQFNFTQTLDRLPSKYFKNSEYMFKYFGINNASDETLNKTVQVLFYNSNSDFAIKLYTNENDEVILYRTNDNKSFNDYYNALEKKSKEYTGNHTFTEDDELQVPIIQVNTVINYDELCGKAIVGTGGLYIQNALQNVNFSLNEKGGCVTSEAGIKGTYLSTGNLDSRLFYFNDSFVVFLKETNSNLPYFALKIFDEQLLVAD